MNNKKKNKISKGISYILRHKAKEEGLRIDEEGFVVVDELLVWLKGHYKNDSEHINRQLIEDIVQEDKKQRYALSNNNKNIPIIRANQGHSVSIKKLELHEITLKNVKKYGLVVHGTYKKLRKNIEENGLQKMSRTHIHMTDLLHNGGADLLRSNVNMYAVVDIASALKDGIGGWYESTNNVVLCESTIPSKYLTFLDKVQKNIGCVGVIVYGYDKNNKLYISLVKTPKNYWSYPKGKKHKGELSIQTGLRELQEETGLTLQDITFINHDLLIENSNKGRPSVAHYVAKYNKIINSLELKPDDPEELSQACWFPYDDIINWNNKNGGIKESRLEVCKRLVFE